MILLRAIGLMIRDDFAIPLWLRVIPLQKFRGGQAVVQFELARKMRGLFEAQPEGDGFDAAVFPQQAGRHQHPFFIQPMLGAALEKFLRVASELPLRNPQMPAKTVQTVAGFPGYDEPLPQLMNVQSRHNPLFLPSCPNRKAQIRMSRRFRLKSLPNG